MSKMSLQTFRCLKGGHVWLKHSWVTRREKRAGMHAVKILKKSVQPKGCKKTRKGSRAGHCNKR